MTKLDRACLSERDLTPRRDKVAWWDCGCITWVEDEKYMILPCKQEQCNVLPNVIELSIENQMPVQFLEVREKEEG